MTALEAATPLKLTFYSLDESEPLQTSPNESEPLQIDNMIPSLPSFVDLRSDTVTKPSLDMREAMASAEVDDDVLVGDPTVEKLQQETAKIFGKEEGLFVPSGTMGNLICILVHCEVRGSEVLLGSESHTHVYEQGGMSTLGGVHPRTIPNNADGTMDLQLLEAGIRTDDDHYPVTRLICLENTHNRCGGRPLSLEYMDAVGNLASRNNLKLHIDGARIFNAATALKVEPARLVERADTVSVCLSKGLGAPVGSVIVGSKIFITKARRLRKALGGGIRQGGIIAAAGLISLQNVEKLKEDHKNAKVLAEGLSQIPELSLDLESIETNIVFVDIKETSSFTPESLSDSLKEKGVLVLPSGPRRIRLVTHFQVSVDDIKFTIKAFLEIFRQPIS